MLPVRVTLRESTQDQLITSVSTAVGAAKVAAAMLIAPVVVLAVKSPIANKVSPAVDTIVPAVDVQVTGVTALVNCKEE